MQTQAFRLLQRICFLLFISPPPMPRLCANGLQRLNPAAQPSFQKHPKSLVCLPCSHCVDPHFLQAPVSWGSSTFRNITFAADIYICVCTLTYTQFLNIFWHACLT